jgi:hypothetical protein
MPTGTNIQENTFELNQSSNIIGEENYREKNNIKKFTKAPNSMDM